MPETNLNNMSLRFDVRRDTKKQSMINVFIRTNAENRKLFRQSLQIDTMGLWANHKEWMRGNSEYSLKINNLLFELRQTLILNYLKLKTRENREPSSSEILKAYFQTIGQSDKTFMALVDEYLAAKGLSISTQNIYNERIKRIFKKYLEYKYPGQTDISINLIDIHFLHNFEFFLAAKYRKPNGAMLGQATRSEYIAKMKALIKYASEIGDLKSYPFLNYRAQKNKTEMERSASQYSRCISPEDLDKIDSTPLSDPALEHIRKLFLFQTWSGMGYADMVDNSQITNKIRKDLCEKDALIYNRSKTGELAIVPLFPELQTIIDELNGKVSPGEYSSYLLGIKKMLKTFNVPIPKVHSLGAHTGRHVFGERTLSMGFSMEAICRMMGHRSIKITETYYARVDGTKIFCDYERILNNQ